ncbi:CBL-interacting serine/threonine-protein kinase 9-like isoform X1 [Andrographis paniculata]|uniref:CBL-interacting serine/threonine-protein kinase 9-like isoform X1 n=1 Tax=Andrographis paniculata TaxID=175694 RepID=UPI0021E938A4|nr:CBL-interacting serine/threonine-protein kinase 9-like isoform X1 [Andrographis paniculata]
MQEDEARKSFKQLINVVDYCHSRGVFDRDTKPENLLDVRARNFKFSDFGRMVWRTPNYVPLRSSTIKVMREQLQTNYGSCRVGSYFLYCSQVSCLLLILNY